MKQNNNYITDFRVEKMWGLMDFRWESIHQDVNILVGVNGCGKTTFLNLLHNYYCGQKTEHSSAKSMQGNAVNIPISYIRSFDTPATEIRDRRKKESPLLQELKHRIYQNGEGTSFFDYRMQILNFPEKAPTILHRIERFFQLIDSLFMEVDKKISIDPTNNLLVFTIGRSQNKIHIEQLSAGEKQMLLILTSVFLQEEKPCVLLMDEPEISLHISWQDRLIELIRQLNPFCQLILTTHSPNIFANGWEDKIVFIEDLEEE